MIRGIVGICLVLALSSAQDESDEIQSLQTTIKINPEKVWKLLLKRSPCGVNIEPELCTCKTGSTFTWPTVEERVNVTSLPCLGGPPETCTCPGGKVFQPPRRQLAAIERLLKNNIGK
ncbi:uncharacterized protein LOC111713976 [Eurytemora carolleeae]|uniref:uncharacterized protein LOC111713976 n=1 Tax=Eurytemora carolleeae TaxID=1294199 RepID=UPI000C76D08E|nr:uncharacterized protein LOC111713976 [Eurytemora carolleeae]|eukprot:XP_023344748.1 uncharacterized protein LOC111713976 [Eurytemora affinis]